jgi:hypothetical protein
VAAIGASRDPALLLAGRSRAGKRTAAERSEEPTSAGPEREGPVLLAMGADSIGSNRRGVLRGINLACRKNQQYMIKQMAMKPYLQYLLP